MKNNHTKLRQVSGGVLSVLLSLCLAFSLSVIDIREASAAEETQTAEPQETESPQSTDEPETIGIPAEEPHSVEDLEEPQIIEVDGTQCVNGEVIVKFKDSVSDTAAENTLCALDSDLQQELPVDELLVTEVPEGDTVEGFIDTLESQPNVEYVQPNYVYTLETAVNDPGASSQWHLSKTGALSAWDITTGSPNIRVAVLDSGADLDHPDLTGQIYAETDVVDNDGSADDDGGHGTHVAGIIAAKANNGIGVAGIAPGVKLIVVDVFGPEYAYTSDIIEGLNFATNNGADVINMSFGCYENDSAFEAAVNQAAAAGAVCVAAAGNESTSALCYPSDYDACVSVIATTSSDTKASYSNYGSLKDISAPGTGIYSTYLNGQYAYMSGTSMASPVTAGVAALIWSANPGLSAAEVKNILYSTAADLGTSGKDNTFGYGRVDALAAVTVAAGELGTESGTEETCEVIAETNGSYGTVSGGGTYASGTPVTLSATPAGGCRFICWLNGTVQLSTDATYTFTVSESCTITAEFEVIGTPVVSASSSGYTDAAVRWSAVAGASGYEVWRSSSASGTYTKLTTTSGTHYTNPGLSEGATYYYKVRAYCAASTVTTYGDLSAYAAITLPVKPVPIVSAAPASYNSIKVSWSAIPGASRYQLYRATSASGKYSLVKTTTSKSYTNKSLKTGTTYYYKVRAYKKVSGKKVYGDYSSIVSAKPVLAKVSGATAKVYSTTSVKISWSKVAGRSGYEVWRSTSPSSGFVLIKSTSSTSYKNTKLTPSVTGAPVTYYYKVRAYRKVSGIRVYSDFTAVTSASPSFADVSGVGAVRSSATKVKISWGRVKGASGYEVLRSASAGGTYTVIKSTKSRSYTNTKLTTGMTYYYKVRAYVKVGSKKVYSAESGAVFATP